MYIQKIILLGYQNCVQHSNIMSNAAKIFWHFSNQLVLNYFNDLTQFIFWYLAKFLDTLAKLFCL